MSIQPEGYRSGRGAYLTYFSLFDINTLPLKGGGRREKGEGEGSRGRKKPIKPVDSGQPHDFHVGCHWLCQCPVSLRPGKGTGRASGTQKRNHQNGVQAPITPAGSGWPHGSHAPRERRRQTPRARARAGAGRGSPPSSPRSESVGSPVPSRPCCRQPACA